MVADEAMNQGTKLLVPLKWIARLIVASACHEELQAFRAPATAEMFPQGSAGKRVCQQTIQPCLRLVRAVRYSRAMSATMRFLGRAREALQGARKKAGKSASLRRGRNDIEQARLEPDQGMRGIRVLHMAH